MIPKQYLRIETRRTPFALPSVGLRASSHPVLAETRESDLKKGPQKGPFLNSGSPGRIRTADKVVNSHLLYQLSYRGTTLSQLSNIIR